MQRRGLLATSVVALTVLPSPVKAAGRAVETASASDGSLYCYAPDDVIVEQILYKGPSAKRGDQLVKLRSEQLMRFRARLESLKKLVDIQKRPFLDGRIKSNLETLKAEADAAQVEYASATTFLTTLKKRFEVATASYTEVQAASTAWEAARAKKVAADLMLFQEPAKTKDSLDKLELALNHLDTEKSLLDSFEKTLTIVAPIDGTFFLEVGLGGFLKKGERIGVIRP